MSREQWLAERRSGIGSSDVAAILSLDPFRTPIDVWLSKVHPEMLDDEAIEKSLPVRLGNKLEPLVAELYSEQTGRLLEYREGWVFRHSKYPELLCTPDRLVTSEKRIVEIKTETFKDNFGDAGSDQIPDHYLCQVAHQLAVLDFDYGDVALLHLPARLGIYPVQRDLELEQTIIDRCREWWHTYVLGRKEPPIDQSPTWGRYLAQKFPREQGEMIEVLDPPTLVLIQELIDIRKKLADESKLESTVENELKAFIGEKAGIKGHWGKILWKKSKDTIEDVTDWKAVAKGIAEEYGVEGSDWEQRVSESTEKGMVTRKGSRRFTLTAKEVK